MNTLDINPKLARKLYSTVRRAFFDWFNHHNSKSSENLMNNARKMAPSLLHYDIDDLFFDLITNDYVNSFSMMVNLRNELGLNNASYKYPSTLYDCEI